jgi:predicted ATPase
LRNPCFPSFHFGRNIVHRSSTMASSVLSSNTSKAGESSTVNSYSESHLDFSQSKVLGREEATNRLHEIYKNAQQGGNSLKGANGTVKQASTVAMIRGLSGTGKSTLAKHFMDELERKSEEPWGPIKPFLLYGKYDDLSGTVPFSALIDAFNGFANMLANGGKAERERVRDNIKKNLGAEANYLAAVVPSLKRITGDSDKDLGSKENASNRLKYAFQKFANTISTEKRPVVLVLDDLQWCDAASADLIEALLTDSDLRHFMFLGTYRSDEMGRESPFYENLRATENSRNVENIELVNLSLLETGFFISDVLNMDIKEVEPLTEMVFNKTSGNIFFVKQALDELHRKGLLVQSPTTFKWELRLGNKDVNHVLSDDVMQVVAAKLRRAPNKLQRALTIAAYSRSNIDFDTLHKLLELDGCPTSEKSLITLLDKAVLDGHLLNSMGSNSYSFSHDRIQQAGEYFFCESQTFVHNAEFANTFLFSFVAHFFPQLTTLFLQVKRESILDTSWDSDSIRWGKRTTQKSGCYMQQQIT